VARLPRLPGGPARDLPRCTREGHASRPVVKDGVYGSPPRQRFRCVGPVVNQKTGELRQFHRFTPALPRLLAAAGSCDVCDSLLHVHDGPISSRSYAFPVREVAAAFVAVGNGTSYARAADRARVSVGRRQLGGEQGGALVAEWLDLLGPVIVDHFAEQAWPETLVLDRTWFMVENRRTHTQTLAFNVLAAYGYPAGAKRGRVWALQATHQGRDVEWEPFLRSLDITVPPRLVITDGETAIANAVRAVWPEHPSPSMPIPFIARCEHHLHVNGTTAMSDDGIGGWAHWLRRRLDTAFLRSEGWDELHDQAVGHPKTQAWLAGIADLETQVAVRHLLPPHHSTAALDTALGTVRDFLDSRSFVLRNKHRTNVTLELIRLHLNGQDLEPRYHTLLRKHLDASAGVLPRQRAGKDVGAGPRTERRKRAVPSLRR
jgi:hypothetical protein